MAHFISAIGNILVKMRILLLNGLVELGGGLLTCLPALIPELNQKYGWKSLLFPALTDDRWGQLAAQMVGLSIMSFGAIPSLTLWYYNGSVEARKHYIYGAIAYHSGMAFIGVAALLFGRAAPGPKSPGLTLDESIPSNALSTFIVHSGFAMGFAWALYVLVTTDKKTN
ncbi:hypothetical protein SeLEV6574_g02214 [Synchytrium endobioticum]|nr:hypothetical protein SeLEV6574_g02214 [Synchytrium endobioticum]